MAEWFRRHRLHLCLSAVTTALIVCSASHFAAVGRQQPSLLADDAQTTVDANASSLVFASVIFRHGDRNPGNSYKNDPYADGSVYVGGWGGLTMEGKRRSFALGAWLRRARLRTLVAPPYMPEHVYALSSDADRCIMSGECLLAGLLPPLPSHKVHPLLDWQPVPLHTVPRHLDAVVSAKSDCPRYTQALSCIYANEKLNSSQQEVLRILSDGSGEEVRSVASAESLYNTLALQSSLRLRMPDWADHALLQRARPLAIASLAAFTTTPFMRRIRGGPLLDEIRVRMAQKQSGGSKLKLFVVSGHDLTLINLLRALGFLDTPWKPDFSATLLVELHKIDGQLFVELWYNNGFEMEGSKFEMLELPECGLKKCPLDTFLALTKNKVTSTWKEDCTTGPPDLEACPHDQ